MGKSGQCRFCISARDNGTRYMCRCALNNKEMSIYASCDEFDDDFGKVVNNASNRLRKTTSR